MRKIKERIDAHRGNPPRSYGSAEPSEQCRTCKGSGKISRKYSEGVAVISLGDERLAPSRTIIYIILAVVLFLGTTISLVAVLYPRPLTAVSKSLQILQASITRNDTKLVLGISVNAHNQNFFTSYVDGVVTTVQFQLREVGANETSYEVSKPSIKARSDSTLNYTVSTSYSSDSYSTDIYTYCCVVRWSLNFKVTVNSKFSYFSTNIEYNDDKYLFANCAGIQRHPDGSCSIDLLSGPH